MKKDFAKSCVYQIYPKSFKDTTGNGIGDLNGVTEKLDYLKELGVDYIWMTPFFISPQNDNGYDVQDYYHIDPLFGTMEDLERLIAEAAKRDMGLMLDMVFNHTSTAHRWFQKALEGDVKYQDYYIFRDGRTGGPPTNWVSKFGGSAWAYEERVGRYYLHLFDQTQADLNWDNQEVREEIRKILRFWKEKGIRGFRFDVINLISKPSVYEDDTEGDGRRFYTDGPKIHRYLREMVEDTGLDAEDIITVGEMSSTTMEHCIRYSNPQEKQLKMCFNFHHLKVDYKDGDKWSLMSYDFEVLKELLHTWQKGMADGNGWSAVFWNNHDQPRAVSRFGDAQNYRKESAKLLATAIHGLRGTPYIYQGEEIGMTNAGFTSIEQYRDVESIHYFDILKKKGMDKEEVYQVLRERSRDNSRTPMQWSPEPYGGFTVGRPWIQVIDNYRTVNVEESLADSDSVFHYYQKLIQLRKDYEVISRGDYRPVETGEDRIFAYQRCHEGSTLTVYCNFSGETREIRLEPEAEDGSCLIGSYGEAAAENGMIRLRPYEAVMLLKNYRLR